MSMATERRRAVRGSRYTEARAVLRILFVAALVLAPVSVIFPMLTGLLLPAVVIVVLTGALLVAISWREQQAMSDALAAQDLTAHGTPAAQGVATDLVTEPRWSRRAAFNKTWRILSFLAVLAVVVAGVLFDPRLLIVGTIGVFAAMALFGLPVWLAAAAQAAEDKATERGRPGLQP